MIVVSDSSPLVALASIGQAQLLANLYGGVIVPEAVWQEVVEQAGDRPGAHELRFAAWLNHEPVVNTAMVLALQENLHQGEAEAIALAMQLKAELLLMDERLGRRTAQHFGLRVIGVVGILVEAKHAQLIPAIKPVLDRLRDEIGFRFSEALYEQVLRDQNEG